MSTVTFFPRFTLFIIIITLFSCNENFGIVEKKEALRSIRYSKADSLTIDSLMAYCYHSGSKYKGVWVMQGTAFYLNYKQRVYLFSALHNFTGVDPETNKLLNSVAGKPEKIEIGQLFEDRVDWRKYYKWPMNDSLAYSVFKDSIRAFNKRPDAGKYYKLYFNKNDLFLGGKDNNTAGSIYDVGAYDVDDSFPRPRHILNLNQNWNTEVMHVGDSVFYWGFRLNGDQLSGLPSLFTGKITNTPSTDNPYITSDVFSRAGNSGSPVFRISNHKISLMGVIVRGNADKNVVYISPIKEAIAFLKLM